MDPVRVRAPELVGAGGWVGGDGPMLRELRGHVVLLHFLTSGCINCVHVAGELRSLERRFGTDLVVLGIHSPKFAHEREHGAVEATAARLRLDHPVLDDAALTAWDAYAVRAWPTLVLVDATGREAARWSGEGHAVEVASAVEALVAERDSAAAGAAPGGERDVTRLLGPPRREVADDLRAAMGELSFPGGLALDDRADPARPGLLVCDAGHDRVLECDAEGTVRRTHDGLSAPQGACTWDDGLVVCETGAHRVWRIAADGSRALLTDRLMSPWGCVRWHGHLVLAEAGRHRLWIEDAAGELQVLAGLGPEELGDGPALEALLAQPSGLAVTADDELCWVDAESSALRVLDRPGGTVRTLVGYDLFSWGAEDGASDVARLQHPLAVAAGADGALYVADTYNGLVRVWRGAHLWTVPAGDLREPGGIAALPDGTLVVADTADHRLVRVDPVAGAAEAVVEVAEPVVAAAGDVLEVTLDVPLGGDDLDPGSGPPVRVRAVATDAALLAGDTGWALQELPARVAIALGAGAGRIGVELRVASCGPDACRVRMAARHFDVVVEDAPDA